MPSLIDLRRRIRSVKNTQQITKAMKMVAASKLRRAQERIMNGRPYAQQMERVLGSVASRVDSSLHPLLTDREIGPDSRTLVIIVSGDKGLCGSFNTNVIKAAGLYVTQSPFPCTLGLVGRKARDFFVRRGFTVAFEETGIFQALRFEDAQRIAQAATDAFVNGDVDRVMLVYNEFKLGHDPARRGQPAAADSAGGGGRSRRPRRRPPERRPLTICTSRSPRRSSISSCPATSSCRSPARCSSRTRRFTPRR